jgi:hypothetical protein
MAIGIRSLGARPHPAPVIVLGNQKSGTTAIAALLGAMTGRSVTLDLKKEMTNPVIDRIRTGELSMAEFVRTNKLDFSREIVKEPSLSPFYEELAALFPRSRFLMVIRDPRDNIRSILNRLKMPGDPTRSGHGHELRVSRAWELVLDGRWLGLMGDDYIDMLAQRWNYVADLYLEHADRIILTQYERFMTDKVGEIGRLARALGLDERYDIADKVDIQFQPAGDRSVRWSSFFGPDILARIDRLCGDRMRRFGYAPSP